MVAVPLNRIFAPPLADDDTRPTNSAKYFAPASSVNESPVTSV
jgi:hypothetical protein